MAAINDLIRQVEDKSLRERLQQEVARLSKQKKFGLVFEDHIPECTPLYGIPIRKGSLVAVKGEDIRDVYCVSSISGGTAAIINKISGNKSERPIETLVVVAQFGEPIYPSLISVDSVTNAPDSSLWHTLIEADNFHALQLLEYLYPKQVDCIYIDPPYNSRAKDWKYNNDYVDPTDSYRHSKWLSMMKRRLKIAKRILNPQNSVLIITIDEKEYLHLGCLLEDMFPEAHIQMVSSVINPKGSARDGFSRSDEYIFFVMFGECTPARLPLSNEWSSSAIVSAQEKRDDDITEKRVEPGWTSMMRRGTDSTRTDSPNLYYPIYVDPETKTIKKIGTSIPLGQDRAEEIPGLVQVLPLRRNGTQGRWQVGNVELKNRIRQGRLRLGRPTAYGFVINYPSKATLKEADSAIENLWVALEKGQSVDMITDRIHKREAEKKELEKQLAIEIKKQSGMEYSVILSFLDYLRMLPNDNEYKRRALVNIFINAIYLYDGYFTMILNAGNRPLSVENIPLDDIEKAFENDDVGCSSNSQLVADAPPRQNNTMRSSAAATGVRSTDGVVFPFQIEPAAPGLISGIFFAYKSWERADQL